MKTLEPSVANVISSYLRVFSVTGWGCTVLLWFNTTSSFRKKISVTDLQQRATFYRDRPFF